jgi:hypothetical protein
MNKEEWKLILNIKNKICKSKLIVTKEDERKILVILTQEEYKHKIKNFIQDNRIMINKDCTQQYHKIIKQKPESSNNIIQREHGGT